MSGGRDTEGSGERQLTVVVEVVLPPEEDHLVLEQGGVDRRDRFGCKVSRQFHPIDTRADIRSELDHVELCRHWVAAFRELRCECLRSEVIRGEAIR